MPLTCSLTNMCGSTNPSQSCIDTSGIPTRVPRCQTGRQKHLQYIAPFFFPAFHKLKSVFNNELFFKKQTSAFVSSSAFFFMARGSIGTVPAAAHVPSKSSNWQRYLVQQLWHRWVPTEQERRRCSRSLSLHSS